MKVCAHIAVGLCVLFTASVSCFLLPDYGHRSDRTRNLDKVQPVPFDTDDAKLRVRSQIADTWTDDEAEAVLRRILVNTFKRLGAEEVDPSTRSRNEEFMRQMKYLHSKPTQGTGSSKRDGH